jgi:PAS domain S-box-containing protein
MSPDWKKEYRQILDSMPIPACLFDPEKKRFVAANPRFCRAIGYTEEELIQLAWPTVMAGDYVQAAEAAMQAEVPPEDATEWKLRHKDGTTITAYVKYQIMHLLDQDSQIDRILFAAIVGVPGQTFLSANEAFGRE